MSFYSAGAGMQARLLRLRFVVVFTLAQNPRREQRRQVHWNLIERNKEAVTRAFRQGRQKQRCVSVPGDHAQRARGFIV